MALEKYIIRIIKATGLSRKEIWKMINLTRTTTPKPAQTIGIRS